MQSFIHDIVGNAFYGELDRLAYELPVILKWKDELALHAEVKRQIDLITRIIDDKAEKWKTATAKRGALLNSFIDTHSPPTLTFVFRV